MVLFTASLFRFRDALNSSYNRCNSTEATTPEYSSRGLAMAIRSVSLGVAVQRSDAARAHGEALKFCYEGERQVHRWQRPVSIGKGFVSLNVLRWSERCSVREVCASAVQLIACICTSESRVISSRDMSAPQSVRADGPRARPCLMHVPTQNLVT